MITVVVLGGALVVGVLAAVLVVRIVERTAFS